MFFNSVTSFNFGTKPIVIRFQEFSRLQATIASYETFFYMRHMV